MINNNKTLRTLLFLGVTLTTIPLLWFGSATLSIPGFSLTSLAHAAEIGKTAMKPQTACASDPTGPHCNNQDPIAQGCSKDAQTLTYKEINNRQGERLAIVQRRYSPTCHSEWGRILQAPKDQRPTTIIIAKNKPRSTLGPIAFSTMIFVPNLSIASEIIGMVSTNGIVFDKNGAEGLAALLPALPATQK